MLRATVLGLSLTLATAASADHPVTRALLRYTDCNKAAARSLAQDALAPSMLSPLIPAMCKAEEGALSALVPLDRLEALKAQLLVSNEEAIKRERWIRKNGMMTCARTEWSGCSMKPLPAWKKR